MTGIRSQLPQTPDTSTPSAGRRWAFIALVGGEALFIGYLIVEAFRADGEWRPWYLLGAGGLSLMVGALVWSRLRRNSARG
ncbi:hypothetical protein [Plantactinospora sp. WMMB782]|uniref:hypothetical protein n=1 Tax=Plantactinospora sp. WMMB782 TaxID=3404121 RepID=UPI003B960F07